MNRNRHLVGALTNLVPGIGFGYLLTGRRRLFLWCVAGWVIFSVIGVILGSSIAALCEFYSCRPGARIMVSAAIAFSLIFVFISVPTAIHMLILALLGKTR